MAVFRLGEGPLRGRISESHKGQIVRLRPKAPERGRNDTQETKETPAFAGGAAAANQ
jgi:hypothetical protein